MIVLKRCLLDTDDEVRDRATFYYTVLGTKDASIIAEYILGTLKVNLRFLQLTINTVYYRSLSLDLKELSSTMCKAMNTRDR